MKMYVIEDDHSGTLMFMPPEREKTVYEPKSLIKGSTLRKGDMWAIGVITFAIVCVKVIFCCCRCFLCCFNDTRWF